MINVLFLCLKNDSLSQLAEGYLNKIGGPFFKAVSAGVLPSEISPGVKQVMSATGLNPDSHHAKSFAEFCGRSFDYVIWIGQDPSSRFRFLIGPWPPLTYWHFEVPEPAGESGPGLEEHYHAASYLLNRVQLFVLSHHNEVRIKRRVPELLVPHSKISSAA